MSDLEQVRQLMLSGYKWMSPSQRGLLGLLVEGIKSFSVTRDSASYVERRRSIRLNCDYAVECTGKDTFPGRVLDVGLTGLRLQSRARLSRGLSLRIVPDDGGGPVPCQVRWCRRTPDQEYLGGLSFELKPSELVRSWVAVLLAGVGFNEEAVYQRRTAVRAPGDLPAQLRSPSDEFLQGRVLDLGVGGALVQVSQEPQVHEGAHRVTLGPFRKLEMLSLNGQVVRFTELEGDNRWNLAVRFLDPNTAQVRLLGHYVLELLGQKPKLDA